MGMDLRFPLKEVLDNEEISSKIFVNDHREFGAKEQEVTLCIKFPGMKYFIELTTLTNKEIVYGFVRANKWAKSYEPITSWFKENDIKWLEC